MACGIKPPLALLLKASISSASKRAPQAPQPLRSQIPFRNNPQTAQPDSWQDLSAEQTTRKTSTATFECPRCTFANHPSLLACELCGAPLISHDVPNGLDNPVRTESPGPALNQHPLPGIDTNESIKLSFRGGGEKIFLERLKGTLIQRKWLLQNAPPVPTTAEVRSATPTNTRPKALGIAGLEQRRLAERQNNEIVIGNAFEDLEALMASAKEIVALAESFAKSSSNTESNAVANALGLVTTKDMLGSSSTSSNLYISELSRNLAEFLTDDARGVLRKAGGIISLVDLWAIFNRARGGVELVSPLDFEKAARLWEKLHLPVRLRQFKSGVLVVQSSDRTDEKTIKTVLSWLGDLHVFPPEKETAWDWKMFGRGVTAQEVAERFGWSLGVAEEELEMCEEKGWLCREEGVEGCRWWENWINELKAPGGGVAYGIV